LGRKTLDPLLRLVRTAAGCDPPVGVLRRAAVRRSGGSADDQARAIALRPRADLRLELAIAVPDTTDLRQRRIEPVTTLGHRDSAHLVVVLAAADRDPEHRPPTPGKLVKRE